MMHQVADPYQADSKEGREGGEAAQGEEGWRTQSCCEAAALQFLSDWIDSGTIALQYHQGRAGTNPWGATCHNGFVASFRERGGDTGSTLLNGAMPDGNSFGRRSR